jgi:Holliday junction resolvase
MPLRDTRGKTKMPLNSRTKGKVGERELRDKIREHGFDAFRGQQYCGLRGNGDVVSPELPVHWECKRVQNLNVYKAYEQAINDSSNSINPYPVVAHRRNGDKRWLATIDLDHLLKILRRSDLVKTQPNGTTEQPN